MLDVHYLCLCERDRRLIVALSLKRWYMVRTADRVAVAIWSCYYFSVVGYTLHHLSIQLILLRESQLTLGER